MSNLAVGTCLFVVLAYPFFFATLFLGFVLLELSFGFDLLPLRLLEVFSLGSISRFCL